MRDNKHNEIQSYFQIICRPFIMSWLLDITNITKDHEDQYGTAFMSSRNSHALERRSHWGQVECRRTDHFWEG